jgi:membrane associated rhomboid family serine protease
VTETDTENGEAPPTCYRHTDRETYVRCTRCDRPICPDCMNEAAVGFQCPDCVKEGNKSIRQARTVFGGRVGADAQVTKVLLGICVVAFVAQLASGSFTDDYAMTPVFVAGDGEYYRMLTSAFLHVTYFPLHIVFNGYALLAFGSQVERLLGGARYLALYLVSAIGGSLLTLYLLDPVTVTAEGVRLGSSVGASGAVFGLFGAFFVLARKLRADTSQILLMIGINLAIGFSAGGLINNWAHIGGLVTGAAVAYVFAHVPRGPRQAALQVAGVAAVVVVLVVATAVRVQQMRQDPFVRNISSVAATSATAAPSR